MNSLVSYITKFGEQKNITSVGNPFKKYNIPCVVPEALNISELLLSNSFKFKSHLKKPQEIEDRLNIIVGELVKAKLYHFNKYKSKTTDFFSVSSTKIKRYVSGYKDYLQFLIQTGVIESDRHYIKGVKCIGYRFLGDYNSGEYKKINVLNCSLSNKYWEVKSDHISVKEYPNLYTSLLGITIDQKKRLLITSELINQGVELPQINASEISLERFTNNLSIPFKITSKRLYTPITNMKKEYRRCLKHKGQNITWIDISNSQPLILISLLDKDIYNKLNVGTLINELISRKDKKKTIMLPKKRGKLHTSSIKYFDLVGTGKLYSYLGDSIYKDGEESCSREEIKRGLMMTLFTPHKYTCQVKRKFEEEFPEIFQYICSYNQDFRYTKNRKKNASSIDFANSEYGSCVLSLLLQGLEAKLVLKKVCNSLSKDHPNIPLFTIHDEIGTTEGFQEILQNKIKKVYHNIFGISPVLTIK